MRRQYTDGSAASMAIVNLCPVGTWMKHPPFSGAWNSTSQRLATKHRTDKISKRMVGAWQTLRSVPINPVDGSSKWIENVCRISWRSPPAAKRVRVPGGTV
jgi:hypothetical protein